MLSPGPVSTKATACWRSSRLGRLFEVDSSLHGVLISYAMAWFRQTFAGIVCQTVIGTTDFTRLVYSEKSRFTLWFNYWFSFTLAYSRISHEYSSLFIIVIILIFLCFHFDAFTELGAFMRTEYLCITVLRVASGPRVKLASCKSALILRLYVHPAKTQISLYSLIRALPSA